MATTFPGSGSTRGTPPKLVGGGGGPTILYTTFLSPFTIDSPHVAVGWGVIAYETASNALFFVAEIPVTTVAF